MSMTNVEMQTEANRKDLVFRQLIKDANELQKRSVDKTKEEEGSQKSEGEGFQLIDLTKKDKEEVDFANRLQRAVSILNESMKDQEESSRVLLAPNPAANESSTLT